MCVCVCDGEFACLTELCVCVCVRVCVHIWLSSLGFSFANLSHHLSAFLSASAFTYVTVCADENMAAGFICQTYFLLGNVCTCRSALKGNPDRWLSSCNVSRGRRNRGTVEPAWNRPFPMSLVAQGICRFCYTVQVSPFITQPHYSLGIDGTLSCVLRK